MADFTQDDTHAKNSIEFLAAEAGLTPAEYISQHVKLDILAQPASRHMQHDPDQPVKVSVMIAGWQMNETAEVASHVDATMTESFRVALRLLYCHDQAEKEGLAIGAFDLDGNRLKDWDFYPLSRIFHPQDKTKAVESNSDSGYNQLRLDLPSYREVDRF